ncbi:MAG: flagellar hook-basal body complex protein [Paracoccus sp. (in: a-proteobacteria)]|uniref:flagellar hook-basal body complex protein n=1 Tax=Paracoccus sp. TaxID=267 RepID=UPI0026E04BD0|nr:flagellar hook-basal body complex protein [Paracoccus sp. (in: a-proteobacteria)]MDO5621233.1 flagellar hook-basal body complex protein [Paracoccus sp. (in: a-proteobacteria)]
MDNIGYATLTRQSGLLREMRVVANNIANADTTGFRREGVVFSEYMHSLDATGQTLSMANARGRTVDLMQAGLTMTGGTFDLGIEGDAFFMVQTPEGNRLTRAGNFLTGPDGNLVTPDGMPVLDAGQAPINIPAGVQSVTIGSDGTVTADDVPVAQVGLFTVADPTSLLHRGGTRFETESETIPTETARIRQGFLEGSNVDPVFEMTRMIEVQRAYEMGQAMLDREDQRIRNVITALTR